MKKSLLLVWLLLSVGIGLPLKGVAQITLQLTRFPANTPAPDTFYLAGNFNNWSPRDTAYSFRKESKRNYWVLTLPWAREGLEFKVTRGSWEKGETLADGSPRKNRLYQHNSDTVQLEIEGWQDFFLPPAKQHTAAANVQVISQDFWMPQLKKNRRIWVYLPPTYAISGKKYPVLYMHDGQNLFDAFYSFSGEWGIDEALNQLYQEKGQEIIVIGVDNGGGERINEYTPWQNALYGGGKGDAYVDFLAQTLKPYIDHHYRTLKGKNHTGVAGSSMGGLISLYAALKYPEVFGRAGVFSPAFWVSPELYDFAAKTKLKKELKIYLIAGAKEGEQMVPDMARMRDLLQQKGVKPVQLKYQVNEDGEHREWYWQREFPGVLQWLFFDSVERK